MKAIFLDVDGILNNQYSCSSCQGYKGIDDDKLIRLKKIVDDTGAVIVISSTWRLGYNNDGHYLDAFWKYLEEKLKEQELSIYDVTPNIARKHRGEEILRWLVDHPEVDKYVILDDDDYDFWQIGPEITDYLVQTDFYAKDGGLQDKHVEKAIKILNGE